MWTVVPFNFSISDESLYLSPQASGAAMVSFFETLRVEVGPEIKITIVTPGFIESEMTQGKFLLKEGKMEVDQDLRDVSWPSPCHIISICTNVCLVYIAYFTKTKYWVKLQLYLENGKTLQSHKFSSKTKNKY